MRSLFRSIRAFFAKSSGPPPSEDRPMEGTGEARSEIVFLVPGMT